MSYTEVFNASLGTNFIAGQPFLFTRDRITLDFEIVVVGGAVVVDWFLEFTALAPTGNFFQEVAEEDAGGGAVAMPKSIRTFQENGGANLAIGTHRLSVQLDRLHQIARIQMRSQTVAPGITVSALVRSPFAEIARSA